MTRIILSLISVVIACSSLAQSKNMAFKDGEEFAFVVSYKIGFVNTELAEVRFKTTKAHHNNKPSYHINAVAQVMPSYRFFFDMRDEYDAWLDENTLLPIYFKNNIREANYRFVSNMTYDWDKMKVITNYKNLRINIDYHKVMPLTKNSFDGLTLFYNLRNTDLEQVKAGFKGFVEMVSCDTIERLEYRFIGREQKNIPRVGKFKTLKFACQITSNAEQSFKDGSEFFLWLSDDENKLPLYIESPIRVGSIKGRIDSWRNLRHPLTSKIK